MASLSPLEDKLVIKVSVCRKHFFLQRMYNFSFKERAIFLGSKMQESNSLLAAPSLFWPIFLALWLPDVCAHWVPVLGCDGAPGGWSLADRAAAAMLGTAWGDPIRGTGPSAGLPVQGPVPPWVRDCELCGAMLPLLPSSHVDSRKVSICSAICIALNRNDRTSFFSTCQNNF